MWVSSLTKEGPKLKLEAVALTSSGWTYVECQASTQMSASFTRRPLQDSADKGWLPDFCLAGLRGLQSCFKV